MIKYKILHNTVSSKVKVLKWFKSQTHKCNFFPRKPHHLSEQLVESPSSSLQALVVQGQFMRNSPTTTSTSSEGANTGQNPHGQPNYPNLGPALHYHCELRPSIEPHLMNVENIVSALYQNNQQIGAEMGWKTGLVSWRLSFGLFLSTLPIVRP